eukprot:10472770-Alexandrium_andersonii.AAC.1
MAGGRRLEVDRRRLAPPMAERRWASNRLPPPMAGRRRSLRIHLPQHCIPTSKCTLRARKCPI